eukprot:917199_1
MGGYRQQIPTSDRRPVIIIMVRLQIDFYEILGPLFKNVDGQLTLTRIFSIQWWLQHIADSYAENPYHTIVEAALIGYIVYLTLFHKPYNPKHERPLTKEEEEELIREWVPEPLVPPLTKKDEQFYIPPPIVEGATSSVVKADGREFLNFASSNYLGIADRAELKEAAAKAIKKYGVGSCGPRGFYGTVDVHLQLEETIRDFFRAPACIIYSDGLACVSSVIPAFSKASDLIICDKGCNFFIQQGIKLSRSNVLYFDHNDAVDLERVLKTVQERDMAQPKKLNRRFIVVEGLYKNYGDLSPLRKIVELKNKYKYRLILDDSEGLCSVGKRGSIDYWNIEVSEVDILCGCLDSSIASVGGFCVGEEEIAYHQRLSGSGYVFSASAPPFTCSSAMASFRLAADEDLRAALRVNARALREGLRKIPDIQVGGPDVSPLIHIRLEKSLRTDDKEKEVVHQVSLLLRRHGIIAMPAQFLPRELFVPRPSLRVLVTAAHNSAQIGELLQNLSEFFRATLESTKCNLDQHLSVVN